MIDVFYLKNKIKLAYYKLLSCWLYSLFFHKFGKGSKIVRPLQLKNTAQMEIGCRVTVGDRVFMMVQNNYVGESDVKLSIDDGATLGNYNHIVALNKVKIGADVLTADRVYISDNYHGYEDIDVPIGLQMVKSKGPTSIGEGTWIGENACVISANIGKHCVIAANSVVVSDIPDYSVAAGAPARVKKRYNHKTDQWEKINIEVK